MDPTPSNVTRYLRAAAGPAAEGPADADLLDRFARGRDEAAFELLVWRHAGMVLRVCRAAVRDHHAAEDACQAVFLALARRAGAVGRRGTVAGWLYRVARRKAARAARRAARRPTPAADPDGIPAAARDAGPDPDAVRLLHEELARLPDRYRVPVLLCFFEGLTQAEAARRLGWPVGTVATRVARARTRLLGGLARRGVTAPAAGLAGLIPAVGSAVGPPFAARTARAAVRFAAGRTADPDTPAAVLDLARGALWSLAAAQLRAAAGAVVACGALAAGVWAAGQPPARPPAAPAAEAPAPAPAAATRRATMAERQRSLNKLRVLMLAILLHEDAYRRLPADVRDAAGRPILSWRVAVLPYLNERDLYERFKLDEPWDSAHNRPLLARMPDAYRAGHEPPGATDTYYQGFAGPGAAFDPAAVRRGPDGRYVASLSIKGMRDHPTTTLALVEAGPAVPWSKPADVPFDAAGPVPAGPFADVLNVATLSGTAYPLRPAVDPLALRALVRTDDGGSRQRPLDTHLAPLLAVTPEDRAALAARIARTREVLRELDRRMGDHLELLAANQDKAAGDLTHAYWQMDELAQLLGQVTRANGQLREAAGLPADPPVPPDRK